ncbi:MAG: PAS domain S-box protein, partial [Halodesulfurarchaeum sp.]
MATALEGADERFTVETARSVDEGRARLGGTAVDCIVSAYDLSDLDGIEFLETVRQGYPDLPFILYTDAGSEAVASEAISAGVTDYVRRKSDDDQHAELASGVRNAVAAYRETRNRKARATAIEETIDGIAILDENGTFRYVNQAHADIYGYDDPQSFIGNTWRMCYSDDALERFDETVVPALHEKGAWRGELEGTRTDGRTFPQELSLSRLDDGRVISVVRDVTARKERKRKLTTLHDVADDLATSTTVESVCERTIEASQDILEFDLSVIDVEADGVLAKTAVSADMPMENMTDMSVTEGIAGKTYRTGESFLVHDVRTVDEANPQGPYRSVISVPIGDHGVFQAVDETTGAFDETDLELAELLISHTESALDRLEHKRELRAFREAVQHTGHVVYWTDPDGTIEYVNPAFETQTGYAAEEAIGENPRILKSGEHDASFYEGLWDAILAGETWHSEVVNEREDGSRYVVEQTITPIVTDDGDVERFVAINTDVTERKRRERALAALHETATELEEATT